MTILYRPYSLVPSTRLAGDRRETFVRVDWVCYLRDEPLMPPELMIRDYFKLEKAGEDMRWIRKRANNFLSETEVDELRDYLAKRYDFDLEVEKFYPPIKLEDLPWFKEKYADSTIILSDINEPYKLSVCIVGIISPYTDVTNLNTVNDFIKEIDSQTEN